MTRLWDGLRLLPGDIGVLKSSHFLAELGEFLGASPHEMGLSWGKRNRVTKVCRAQGFLAIASHC